VHGFIDFAYPPGIEPRKVERTTRKKRWAADLQRHVGDHFDAVVSGVTPKATWVQVVPSGIAGRLVRGGRGLTPGTKLRVILLRADPGRGYIDFARDE
jgi:ribonuclease R